MTTTRRTRSMRIAAICLVLTFLAAACSASNDDSGDNASVAPEPTSAPAERSAGGEADDGDAAFAGDDAVATETAAEEPASVGAGDTVGGLDSLTPADIGRDIVFTAEVRIAADDVALAGRAALDAIAPLGGLLFGQETTTDPRPRTVLVIKVRPEDFSEALERLSGIGDLVGQRVSADDVTERIVDLESRIVTAEASVARLRGLLDDASGLDEIATLERELLNREQSLEQLRGQLRTVQDAVSLATITLVIEERTAPRPHPDLEVTVGFYSGDDDGRSCPVFERTRIDEGDVTTICVELVNTGDTLLGDIALRDRGLDLDTDDFVRIDGGTGLIEPEQGAVYAATFTAGSTRLAEVRITALAHAPGPDGAPAPLDGETVTVVAREELRVTPDDSLPGFRDGLDAAVSVLGVIVGIAVLAAGVAVPFLWILVIVAVVWWMRRRGRTAEATKMEE